MNSGKKRPQGGGSSKSRPGQGKGRSFGGKKAGADDRKPRKRFEDSGDKPRKRFEESGDKPRKRFEESGDKPRKRFEDSGDKPRKRFEDSGDKPRRTYGEAGDRPRKRFEDSGDRPRRPYGEAGDRPRRTYEESGDRPRKRFEDSGDKPRRTYGEAGDRPRRTYEESGDKPRRTYGEAGDRPRKRFEDSGDKPRRTYGEAGDRPRKRFEDSGDKPRRTYGEAGDRPRRTYEDSGDRPRRPSENSGDRPRKRFEDSDSPRDRRPRDFDDRRPRRFDGPGSAAADLANLDEEAPPERTRVGRYGSHAVTELPSFDAETQAQVDAEFIYGRNSVVAFLERGEAPVNKIFIAKDIDADKRIDKINALAKENGIPTVVCDKVKLSTLIGDRDRHQGVVAQLAASEFVELPDFLDRLDAAKKESEEAGRSMDGYVIAILDGIEDPHNIGAIIRSADAAGVKAILLPQRRSAGLTATVAKVSAGALANMTVVRVTNIVSTLEKLKDRGFWVAGTSLEGESLYKSDLKRPLALVIGSESDGISRLVAEHCDMLLKIPMQGSVQSLNASVAAGVVFYEIVRQNS